MALVVVVVPSKKYLKSISSGAEEALKGVRLGLQCSVKYTYTHVYVHYFMSSKQT